MGLQTIWAGVLITASVVCAAEKPVSFSKDIRPIFASSCWKCHGAAVQLSKLDLRTRESALKGGAHGPALAPGNAEQSESQDQNGQRPPPGT